MSVGGKVIEVMDQYDLIWINTLDGTEQCAIYVISDDNSRLVSKGDLIVLRGEYAFWTSSKKGSDKGVRLTRAGGLFVPRPEPTATSVMQKERQKLIDESKGLECEIRTMLDMYEDEIVRIMSQHKKDVTIISSSLVNCRIYSMVISVIAFVSTYLHFG